VARGGGGGGATGGGAARSFEAIARLDGPIELDYYRQGGILPAVLRRLARASKPE
jgi:aconitate hydratase